MDLRTFGLAALLAFATAPARAADAPPAPPPQSPPQQAGAGGDSGAKPKAAAMIIEEEAATPDAVPPPPVGDERRAIGEYIHENSGPIRECYEKALERRRTLQGKLVVRFDIGPNGRVIGATADGIQDRELILCVVQQVRNWGFAKPASGGKLRIAYPFKFEAQPGR